MKKTLYFKFLGLLAVGLLLNTCLQACDPVRTELDENTGKLRIVVGAGTHPQIKRFHPYPTKLNQGDVTIDIMPDVIPSIVANYWTDDWSQHDLVKGGSFDEFYVAHVGFGLLPTDGCYSSPLQQWKVLKALIFCIDPFYRETFSDQEKQQLIQESKIYGTRNLKQKNHARVDYDDLSKRIIDKNYRYLDQIRNLLKPKGIFYYESENPLPPTPITHIHFPDHKSASFDLTRQYSKKDYLKYTLRLWHGLIPCHKVEKSPFENRNFFHESVLDPCIHSRDMERIFRVYECIFNNKGFVIEQMGFIKERRGEHSDILYTFQIIAKKRIDLGTFIGSK